MITLVTGATGTVGAAIVRRLLDAGRPVRALVREPARAAGLVPGEVELARGDVTDAASVARAVDGCGAVFHAAGLPEQWLPDARAFRAVNVEGSINVGTAALAAGVGSFVYTSTIDVFAWARGRPFDESTLAASRKGSAYERSKQAADRALAALAGRGLPVRYAHPSAVYGDAPALNPGLNELIVRLVRGGVPLLLPGGIPVVMADDVARGHLALEAAPAGTRAIFHDRFVSLVELARASVEAARTGKVPPVLPALAARALSVAGEALSKFTRRPPVIAAGQLQFLLEDVHPSAARARRELGWAPTPFGEGMVSTIAAFRRRGWV